MDRCGLEETAFAGESCGAVAVPLISAFFMADNGLVVVGAFSGYFVELGNSFVCYGAWDFCLNRPRGNRNGGADL